MSLFRDALAGIIRESVSDDDATKEDWDAAVAQVFPQAQPEAQEASLNERVFDALMAAGKKALADEYADANPALDIEALHEEARGYAREKANKGVYDLIDAIGDAYFDGAVR